MERTFSKVRFVLGITLCLAPFWQTLYAGGGGITWSPYQGEMKWKEATEKCKSLGMRLPSIEELIAAYNSAVTKAWPEQGAYWSSSKYAGDYYSYWGLHSKNGIYMDNNKHYGVLYVRCVR
ncbi:DUF1566 domain-containing protein [Turneriella parva]|uniref:DUF1566 domain-containing protein n=1 Tax=Turneriella parva (strain ATCC BAA-1111 / DSM 21527 / NCTC 11395 / H) TaxID=869212 RepID=I4B9P3_TURPD|nr:DUF1566 domain-containing protein [Turneriella parva]AFM14000.1 hypothetical protein Turpa_3362 [Turneriella parva DSM 21527]